MWGVAFGMVLMTCQSEDAKLNDLQLEVADADLEVLHWEQRLEDLNCSEDGSSITCRPVESLRIDSQGAGQQYAQQYRAWNDSLLTARDRQLMARRALDRFLR
jgi:hypothetical protein